MNTDSYDSDEVSSPEKSKVSKIWNNQPFNSNWLADPELKDWIKSVKESKYAVKCKVCDVVLTNANKSVLIAHKATKKHSKNFEREKNAIKVDTFFALNKESSLHEKVAKAELLFAAFMAEHYMPFRQANHMAEVMKRMFPDSAIAKAIYYFTMKRTKASYIMQEGVARQEKLKVNKICFENKFLFITDESTDVLVYQIL